MAVQIATRDHPPQIAKLECSDQHACSNLFLQTASSSVDVMPDLMPSTSNACTAPQMINSKSVNASFRQPSGLIFFPYSYPLPPDGGTESMTRQSDCEFHFPDAARKQANLLCASASSRFIVLLRRYQSTQQHDGTILANGPYLAFVNLWRDADVGHGLPGGDIPGLPITPGQLPQDVRRGAVPAGADDQSSSISLRVAALLEQWLTKPNYPLQRTITHSAIAAFLLPQME